MLSPYVLSPAQPAEPRTFSTNCRWILRQPRPHQASVTYGFGRRKLFFRFLLLLALIYFSWSARKHKLWTSWPESARSGEGAAPRHPSPQWEMFQGPLSPYAPFCERHLQGYCVNRTLRYFLRITSTEVDWKNCFFGRFVFRFWWSFLCERSLFCLLAKSSWELNPDKCCAKIIWCHLNTIFL